MYVCTYDSTFVLTILFYELQLFLEVTILFTMIRLYFLGNTNYDCSQKGRSCIIHKCYFSRSYMNYYATGQVSGYCEGK